MRHTTKTGTVTLIVRIQDQAAVLVDQISDDRELQQLEASIREGERDPLQSVYDLRAEQSREDEEFGDYVEELLSQPFVRPEIQEHGLQWLKSKLKIEEFQRTESEATRVIAQYAFKIFQENPQKTDFILAGPVAQVRIRVVTVPETAGAAKVA